MDDSSKLRKVCAQIERTHAAVLHDEDGIFEVAKNARVLMARIQENVDNVSALNVKRLISRINERQQVISNSIS